MYFLESFENVACIPSVRGKFYALYWSNSKVKQSISMDALSLVLPNAFYLVVPSVLYVL